MMQHTIVFPLPDRDFDVTEVAAPWMVLTRAGHRVVFATEHGATPAADPLLFDGLPFGLGARGEAIAAYRALEASDAFRRPVRWSDLRAHDTNALFLAGGHAQGMRQYLGSEPLQRYVADVFRADRPIAAICHGVLVPARAKDPETGRSPLYDRQTTCLPKYMERGAYLLTAWKLGRYYRTHDVYVEDEVRAAQRDPSLFARGPCTVFARGTDDDDGPAFAVKDGRYVSGRWPGDAWLVARKLDAMLRASRFKAASGRASA
jgi:putative intracellular protease/amidase